MMHPCCGDVCDSSSEVVTTEKALEALRSDMSFSFADAEPIHRQEIVAAGHREFIKLCQASEELDASPTPTLCPSAAGMEDNLTELSPGCNSELVFDEQQFLSEVGSNPIRVSDPDRTARMHKLRYFLAPSGFRGVNSRKSTGTVAMLSRSFTYPLHAAVRAGDAEAVSALLWAGAERTTRDSQKRTPLQLALKLNRRGAAHASVIELLSA